MRTHTSKPNYSYSTNRAQERKKKESVQISSRGIKEQAEQESLAEPAVGEWGSITSKVMRTIESGQYHPDPGWEQHMAQLGKARGTIANVVRTAKRIPAGSQQINNSISPLTPAEGLQIRATNPITPVCRKNPAFELKATPHIFLANGGVVQRKLTIGEPNDKYEQEADRVAAEVVQQINRPAPVSQAQGESVQGKKRESEELRMKSKLQGESQKIGGGVASSNLERAINRARGGGRPLDAGLQESMGQAMGADFSGVRVHTDAQADRLNKSIHANAFTTGQDVFFRQGAYEPRRRGGQELLAHELTHVVQQKQGVKGSQMATHGQARVVEAGRGGKEGSDLTVIKERGRYGYTAGKDLTLYPKLHRWLPQNKPSNDRIYNKLSSVAKKVDKYVEEGRTKLMSGDFNDGQTPYQQLYLRRLYAFTNGKGGMHPSTAAGYVIEEYVNKKIENRPDIDTQNTTLMAGTRPDVVIYADQKYGLVDITSQASLGHIFSKAGGWNRLTDNRRYIAESTYQALNFDRDQGLKEGAPPSEDAMQEATMEVMRRLEKNKEELKTIYQEAIKNYKVPFDLNPEAEYTWEEIEELAKEITNKKIAKKRLISYLATKHGIQVVEKESNKYKVFQQSYTEWLETIGRPDMVEEFLQVMYDEQGDVEMTTEG